MLFIINLFLVILSSSFLILSFADFDLGFFAWIGLVPLFIAINGKRLIYGLLLSLVCGMLFFLGIFYWILVVPKYTLLHHALLAVYLGSYFGFFGLTLCFISRRLGSTPALFSAPFIWVSLEYIRGNLSFLAHPWGLLAHSQYQYPSVIQIASLAGTYGISFLIVLVNAAIASLILKNLPSPGGRELRGGENEPLLVTPTLTLPCPRGREIFSGKERRALVALAAGSVVFTLLYGAFTTSRPIAGNRIKISLVQGNIEQSKKWDPRFAREIMQTYGQLTEEVSKDHPSLIIWPETATPGSITQNPWLYMEIRKIVKNTGTALLFGSAQHQKFREKETQKYKYSNSAYLIDPDSRSGKNQRYDKIRLFPFGEYLPYKEIIPWSLIKVSGLDSYTPGKEFTVFEHPNFRFGVTICWENVFPDLVRQFVKRGAQCIVNLTNEARFEKTAAPHQLVSMSVFRAVENGIYVVRCANTGVSCIIDPSGRIVERVKDERNDDIFVRGTMTGWIIPLDSKTIYTRYGDWFVWVAFVGSVAFLLIGWCRGRKVGQKQK